MKINIGLEGFENSSVEAVDFPKHICAVVLHYYIKLEEGIIKDNKGNDEVIALARENLNHLKASKKYIESYYKETEK